MGCFNIFAAASQSRDEQLKRMTEAPIGPLIISLAIPTILSMLTTALYNTADTYFVSQLGTSASGAVGRAACPGRRHSPVAANGRKRRCDTPTAAASGWCMGSPTAANDVYSSMQREPRRCQTGCFAPQNGRFWTAIWAVLQCKTAHIRNPLAFSGFDATPPRHGN